MDVTDAASVAAGFVQVDDAGRLDIVVNNAGIDVIGRVEDLSEGDWDTGLDTNLKGPFLVARQAIPRLRSAGGGVIVNVASNAGLVARADEPAYSTSKAGLLMLTRSLALAHAEDRIRVNSVCPGPVGDTGIMDRNLARASDPGTALASYLREGAAGGRLGPPDRPGRGGRADPLPVLGRRGDDHGRDDHGRRRQEPPRFRLTERPRGRRLRA